MTLGDSITQAGGYQALMQKVLARFYPDLKIEIVNAGIGGHKAPDMAARLQRDVIDKKAHDRDGVLRRKRRLARFL